ncbi:hypothetical protein AB0P17_28710 [Streptomyces sp. NPDC088124]|uniref:hypothetical protein n=1 Tax=Streptomyces sp. NPDC088124 TaxID=3154654 RepID=UPI00342ACC4E
MADLRPTPAPDADPQAASRKRNALAAVVGSVLVFCRILQGLGVGATLGGAYMWTTESAKPTQRGFYAALPTLFAAPFWLLVGTKSLPVISMAVSFAFAVTLNSVVFGPAGSFYSELLPTEVRFSGLVPARETTAVLFSGTAPFIATLLVGPCRRGHPMAARRLLGALGDHHRHFGSAAAGDRPPRALRRKAIESGASDGSTPIDVEYAEVWK